MKISVLSSGSKGNSSLFMNSQGGVLLDCGLSAKRVLERVSDIGYESKNIQAIVVTHDHSDHIKGVGILARKLKIPIFIHKLNYENKIGLFTGCEIRLITNSFSWCGFEFDPFTISHDGSDNYAYNIYCDNKKITHLTDCGFVSTLVKEKVKDCDLLVLETNHDYQMLINGNYPWYLKQRVRGRKGHLSNTDAANLVHSMELKNIKNIILAHISQENNDPILAYDVIQKALELKLKKNIKLFTSYQHKSLDIIDV